ESAGSGLGRGPGRADRVIVHLPRRPRQEDRGRIPATRKLAVLLGVASCEWNMLASVVSSDDEADGIEYRIFLLPKADYKILDTWNVAGCAGRGLATWRSGTLSCPRT